MSLLQIAGSSVALFFGAIALYIVNVAIKVKKAKTLEKNLKLPPSAEESDWLTGNLRDLAKTGGKAWIFHQQLHDKLGDIVSYRVFNVRMVSVANPEFFKKIGVNKSMDIAERTRTALAGVLGKYAILAVTGETWKRHRKLITPLFWKEGLRSLLPYLNFHMDELIEDWNQTSKNGSFNVVIPLGRLALDLIGRITLGTNFKSLKDPTNPITMAAVGLLGKAVDIAANPVWKYMHPFLYRKFTQDRKIIRDLVTKIIDDYQKNPTKGAELYATMLEYSDPETGEKLSSEEVRDEVTTFIFGGSETTSTTLSWILYYVSQNPHVQEKLQKEIDEVVGKEVPTLEDLDKLNYVKDVIKESNRLTPGAEMVSRTPFEDITIEGYDIPKGSMVFLDFHAVNHSPKVWDEPEKFNPERWSSLENDQNPGRDIFTFGVGYRMCWNEICGCRVEICFGENIPKFLSQVGCYEAF